MEVAERWYVEGGMSKVVCRRWYVEGGKSLKEKSALQVKICCRRSGAYRFGLVSLIHVPSLSVPSQKLGDLCRIMYTSSKRV